MFLSSTGRWSKFPGVEALDETEEESVRVLLTLPLLETGGCVKELEVVVVGVVNVVVTVVAELDWTEGGTLAAGEAVDAVATRGTGDEAGDEAAGRLFSGLE